MLSIQQSSDVSVRYVKESIKIPSMKALNTPLK
jgi:hypothetical protein